MLLPSTREMRSSPRRGNGYSKRLSDGLGFRESPITLFVMAPLLFVMAPLSPLDGWRKEAWQLQRKKAGNKPAKQFCPALLGTCCTARICSDGSATEAASKRVDLQGGQQWGRKVSSAANRKEEDKAFPIPWPLSDLTHKLLNVSIQNAHFSFASQGDQRQRQALSLKLSCFNTKI